MRCEQVQSMLSAYMDGELAARHALSVSQHLTTCEACRAESTSLSGVVTALRSLAEDELPTGLHGAILHALDAARPSLWQRLCAATLIFQPARPLAFGTIAAALAILAVTSPPLQRDAVKGLAMARIPYRGVTYAVASLPAATPAPAPAAAATPPVETRELALAHPVLNAPVIVETSAESRAQRSEPVPSETPRGKTVVAVARPVTGTRGMPENDATRRTPAVPMSTFDPLAPVLEPTGSRMDPAMANVVVVEPMPTMPQPESSLTASGPAGPEVTTASVANDDLATLRQRLSQEQIQLPAVKLKPRRRFSKHIPLIHSDF
jgi:anti-sigma factor RsiW